MIPTLKNFLRTDKVATVYQNKFILAKRLFTTGTVNFSSTKEDDCEKAESTIKRISIYRYDPESEETPYMQEYEIDTKESGGLILDMLNYIKNEIDPTLAFRRSCREGICGSCSMNINGQNKLACISRCPTCPKVTIYPLPHMYVVKDLVCDMNQFYEQYSWTEPWLQRCDQQSLERGERELKQSIRDRAKLDGMYECILCACCSTSCPAYWWHGSNGKGFAGPAALLHAYRWIIDSRDDNHEARLKNVREKLNPWRCHTIFNCAVACPKSLNPGQKISKLKLMCIGRLDKEEPDMDQDDLDEDTEKCKIKK